MSTAESEELFFVVNEFLPRAAGEGIVLHEEDRFFRADFLAVAAKNAAEHIDLKFFGSFFDIANLGAPFRAGRFDTNGFWRAYEFAQLTGNAFGASRLIFHEVRRATITFRNDPTLLGILHGHFLLEEVAQADLESAEDGRNI